MFDAVFFFAPLTQDPLLICTACEQGFHAHCLDPPVEKRPKNWTCAQCAARRKSKQTSRSSDALSRRGRKRANEDQSSDEEEDEEEEDDQAEVEEAAEKIPPPPGVTVRDVELFKKVQHTTAEVTIRRPSLTRLVLDFCFVVLIGVESQFDRCQRF